VRILAAQVQQRDRSKEPRDPHHVDSPRLTDGGSALSRCRGCPPRWVGADSRLD